MAVYVRTKRVTDPLNDRVKACLRGEDHHRLCSSSATSSSGSDHDVSDSLSDLLLLHGFDDDDSSPCDVVSSTPPDQICDVSDDEASVDRRPSLPSPAVKLRDLLHPDGGGGDRFRIRLVEKVEEAVGAFSALRSNRSALRRAVMGVLREAGYNAGVCKTRWEASGNLTAGNHEFIDVISGPVGGGGDPRRYVVDLDFAGEFEIARPTAEYGRVMEAMPRGVVVVEAERLRRAVRAVAEAAKRSMKARGLSLPPWRKARYAALFAIAKWLGPYRRSTASAISSSTVVSDSGGSVGCRAVGFDAAVSVLSSVTQTI
ncbi:hypothetical protein QJS10_CPA16g00505 [Acorus calamus]|uniref:DUF506 family protein n=1 Tax=Acorus calamus TaxID=4465 RepID=A0AAV9D0V2_ACOCL|nr:hypothetical protein QJS10_CPA16g00505 [Acorus calamus]